MLSKFINYAYLFCLAILTVLHYTTANKFTDLMIGVLVFHSALYTIDQIHKLPKGESNE